MTTDDPNRRPRTAAVLGDVVIARRHLTGDLIDGSDPDRLGALSASVGAIDAVVLDANLPPAVLREQLVALCADLVEWVEEIDERAERAAEISPPPAPVEGGGQTWAQAQGGAA